jgi:Ras association (RalGDS/AF-6) domain.
LSNAISNGIFFLFSLSDERKLGTDEKPLLVQLNWHKDDREGRFLLRRIDEATNVSINHTGTQ